MAEPDKQVTLREVAQRAGVSLATASKAINQRFDVAPATRERVMRIASEMNFHANALARSLVWGTSRTIGIVTNDIAGRFVSEIMHGAEIALGLEDSTVLLANSQRNLAREERLLTGFAERRVDGVIIVDSYMEARPPAHRVGGLPAVYVYGWSSDPRDISVIPDAEAMGRVAAQHLVDIGRRHIVVISGEAGTHPGVFRVEGARQALATAGVDLGPSSVLFGPWSEQWGWDAIGSFLERGLPVDGVVAGDDAIARGVIERVLSAGRSVPGDIAVVGQDNRIPLVNGRLPITSVDMRLAELGVTAVRMLLDPTARVPGVTCLAPQLVVRQSTVAGSDLVEPESLIDAWQ